MTQRKWTDSTKAFYSEGGAMLRHYSAVRATVVSMGLTVLFALWTIIFLYARQTASVLALSGISMIVFLYVCAVGIFFSGKYEQVRVYLLNLEAGSEIRGPYEAVTTRYRRQDWKLDMINWWILGLGSWLQLTLLFIKLELFTLLSTA